MVTKQILIIDDERFQAEALCQTITEIFPEANVFTASTEEEINVTISEKFYNLVLLDLRMDGYSFDGVELAKNIIGLNPFAKILFVSRFVSEYIPTLNPLLAEGAIIGFSEKKDYDLWKPELQMLIGDYYRSIESEPSVVNSALLEYYAQLKNETDTYKKGQQFENFVSLLFRSIGFNKILKREKDASLNEIDLIIRNEIEDSFLNKLGKYILIECKNKPSTNTDKNDYIIFRSKLEHASCMAEIGIIFTTSTVTRNTYIEAARNSSAQKKIIIIDNALMHQLLQAEDLKEELKCIIDHQVKDN